MIVSLFLTCLGVNYLFAFVSLVMQVKGLYGAKGIAPIHDYLTYLHQRFGKPLYFKVPTVFWFNSSDQALIAACWLGIVASVSVILGFFIVPCLILLWLAYLSFMSVGNVFLSFQWDCLLLEVGFASIFYAMLTPPPLLLTLLMWVILFKLVFSSGVVKYLSGCPEWRALKALDFHYETQPLPNRVAYYVSRLPKWFSRFSLIFVLFLEIIVPFFIFGPAEVRLMGFDLLVLLQVLIMLTGNYAFFNTLTIALCIPLLMDVAPVFNLYSPLEWIMSAFAFAMIILNAFVIARLFVSLPRFDAFWSRLAPYYILNSYGLFARMTTQRNEIIVEGSNDGIEWKAYEFKWKPGDLKKAPKQIAPFQPRLDWQMWFAALSHYRYNDWYIAFLQRLLEGSDDVLNLLKSNPFPDEPPKYIRGQLFQYHFSSLDSKDWWVREQVGLYSPPLKLSP